GLAAADHGAQPGAAGADHYHVIAVVLDRIGAAVGGRIGSGGVAVAGHGAELEDEHGGCERGRERDRDGEERVGHHQDQLGGLVVHVVLDDDLHADAHVHGHREDEQQHDHGDQRGTQDLHHRGVVAAEQRYHDQDEGDG